MSVASPSLNVMSATACMMLAGLDVTGVCLTVLTGCVCVRCSFVFTVFWMPCWAMWICTFRECVRMLGRVSYRV